MIVDSESDITLISQAAFKSLKAKPKIKKGQKIDLIQVTGWYVTLDLIFHTDDGPVKIEVEAYIMKGMTTSFILGNGFMDQYLILIIWDKGDCYLDFGSSGWWFKVDLSTGPVYLTNQGHNFRVQVIPNFAAWNFRTKTHQKNQKNNRRLHSQVDNLEIWAMEQTIIPPKKVSW